MARKGLYLGGSALLLAVVLLLVMKRAEPTR